MERVIYDLNRCYLELRQANIIGSLELKLVKNGTFESLKNQILLKGASETQFKMPPLVEDSALVKFLESRVIYQSGLKCQV
ncbi:MAG: GH3 auxin-responsive promoter family protein [Xenococcaceae cyanobacterium]